MPAARLRRMTIDDVVRLARPTEPRLSVRGDLAYVVTLSDVEGNRVRSEVRVRRRSGASYFYQGEGDSSPRWSPSGDLLAFASRRGSQKGERGSGVFVAGDGGEPRRVAWFKHGVVGLEWLDGRSIVVMSSEEVSGMYDSDGDYVVTDRLPLWFDGEGLVAGLRRQLYLLDVESGRVVKLTSEDEGVEGFTVCGGRVYYFTPRTWRDPLDMIVKSVEPGGDARVEAEGFTVGQLGCVGGRVYMVAHRRPIGLASHYRLHIIRAPGRVECLTCEALDRNVRAIAGGLDGEPVIVYADRGRGVIARVESGGLVRDIFRRDAVVLDAHAEAGMVAFVASSPDSPPEVYLYRGGGVERVSSVNSWLAREVRLYKPERLEVEAAGDRIEGWVLVGEGEGPRPLILFIHGGPKGMYGYMFYPEMQLFASEGFIVAYANPRGSDGYSEEFADIRGRYGEVDYEQLMAFVEEVARRYPVDRGRMAVTGISYGGYMTNVIITKTTVFKAAVSENGIADWIADFWAADIGYWFDPDQIGGTPMDNVEEYIRRSPAFHAGRVETPLMIIHSMEDYRCFIDQALAMHTALKTLGKDSVLVVFRRGSHGHSVTGSPRHRRKRLEIKVRWIKEKLGLKG